MKKLMKVNKILFYLEIKMFKQTATDLTKVSLAMFQNWINSFDTILFDCDGKK